MAKSKKKPVKKAAAKKPVKKAAPKKASAKSPAKKATAPKTTAKSQTFKAQIATALEKLQPLDDRVLIEPAGKAEKTAGGIIIPDLVEDRPLQGKVLAVGRGHLTKKGNLKPLDVKIGDEILYAKFAGTSVQLSGRDLLLLREDDILGIVK